jgi:hypothetical protein
MRALLSDLPVKSCWTLSEQVGDGTPPLVIDETGDVKKGRSRGTGRGRFAIKPAQARQMVVRALDGGAPAPWVTGDEVCGADPDLR